MNRWLKDYRGLRIIVAYGRSWFKVDRGSRFIESTENDVGPLRLDPHLLDLYHDRQGRQNPHPRNLTSLT